MWPGRRPWEGDSSDAPTQIGPVRERVEPGARIDLTYLHSTEGRPVRATLRVEADRTLRLVETAYPSVGPGLPPLGPEGTWSIEGGVIVNRAPSTPLPELRIRAVPLQHRLILPSGRSLDLSALGAPGDAIRLAVQ